MPRNTISVGTHFILYILQQVPIVRRKHLRGYVIPWTGNLSEQMPCFVTDIFSMGISVSTLCWNLSLVTF
jgi:hypothetical protein